ncbi:MAG: hypothetical protein ACR2JV_03015 [Gaiellales bacterium]
MDRAFRIGSSPAFKRERAELLAREPREAVAIAHAVAKLVAEGTRLGHPWTSAVRGSSLPGLRELRPRAGRSRHRVLYRQVPGGFDLLALAPEAQSDRRAFEAAVRRAVDRAAESDRGSTTCML